MFKNKTILSQMQELIFRFDFQKTVNIHSGDKGIKQFTTKNLMSLLLFAQMSGKESIRELIDSLRTKKNHWYHLNIKSISRNNISHSLMNRSSHIFEDTYYKLLNNIYKIQVLNKKKKFKFKNPVRCIDSTTISLSLSLFDWAKFRKTKGGIKLHVSLNPRNEIPELINVTEAKSHDVKSFAKITIVKNSILVFDKGYLSFKLFNRINENKAFFVTRTKKNTCYKIKERLSKPNKNIKADWIVKLYGVKKEDYTEALRIVRYYDKNTNRIFEYITNNFKLSAQTIADIYKSRWDIELFFKWIKQNLKIKTFLGTSENAVRIQIFSALITYLLLKFLQFQSKLNFSLLQLFRILKDMLMTSIDLYKILFEGIDCNKVKINEDDYQLYFSF